MKPEEKYCECMLQILSRIHLLIEIIDDGKSLGNESFDFEVVALNFRKILELIAYSSMVANKDAYLRAHTDAEKHHRAKDILTCVESLNKDFYPEPMIEEKTGENEYHLTSNVRDYLTREDFVILYDRCSKIIHVPKVLFGSQSVDFILTPREWLRKITALLDRHKINLLGTDDMWFVRLKDADGQPHAYTLGKKP